MAQHLIKHQPTFSLLQLTMQPGEVVVAEAGSMVACADGVELEVRLNAGASAGVWGKIKALFVALVRKLVGGETFFVNHFQAAQGGWVWIAPALSGGISHIPLTGQRMLFSTGAYLASAGAVELSLRFGGLRALLAKEGAFFLEVGGHGDLWINSYGAIDEIYCDGTYVVDNGHIVGFDASLDFEITTPGGGAMGLFASGEGLVCQFTGRGRILVQSRNLSSLVGWLSRML